MSGNHKQVPSRYGLCSSTSGMMMSRRQALLRGSMGFGGIALAAMLKGHASASQSPAAPSGQILTPSPHFSPRARNVIFVFLDGGLSQIDSFDPKPLLEKYDGKPFPSKMEATQFNNNGNTLSARWAFKKYGQSGIEVSDLFPYIGKQVDDIAMIRSVVTTSPEHTIANYMVHTGSGRQGFPSMGSWLNYGLGSVNHDLPGYIVLESKSWMPPGGPDNFGAGFLPSRYQGSLFRADGPPVSDIEPLESKTSIQRDKLDLVNDLDRMMLDRTGRIESIESAISNFELAFRMQSAVPGLMDLKGESEKTKNLYGVGSPDKKTSQFGQQCLLARRMVEHGVRFVELLMPDGARWDQHAKLKQDHGANAHMVDQPVAGLLIDLKSRGLLDETLVVFATEFGRTPFAQGKDGRDHNEYGCFLDVSSGISSMECGVSPRRSKAWRAGSLWFDNPELCVS